MGDFPIPQRLTRGQLSGWCCVTCYGLVDPGVEVGRRGGRKLFACSGCFEAVTGLAVCGGCKQLVDADELRPDHNSEPACRDCLSTWGEPDDGAEWCDWAYAA